MKGRPLSAKSVSHAFALLRGALGWAHRQELIVRNVGDVVETPSIPRGRAVALTVEEVHGLLAAADETRWGPFFRVALGCGARRGELLALQWSDVDFEDCTLTIGKSLSETRAGIAENVTKTDRVRIVALPELAMDAFRRQRRLQAAERLAAGPAFVDSGHVFQRQRTRSDNCSSMRHGHRMVTAAPVGSKKPL